MQNPIRRRDFLRSSSLGLLPFVAPLPRLPWNEEAPAGPKLVNFIVAGEMLNAQQYAARLNEICSAHSNLEDTFAEGGCVAALEAKFEAITGKEKAKFIPTGTMANQLAIKVLSGDNAKVFVQENSHVYRDEADAAQTVHGKRLIPLGKEDAPFFSLDELKAAIDYHNKGEVFRSGIGAVSVEIPVRRTDGRMIPVAELRKISAYCRENKIPLHLDGARIYMASAWSGVPVSEYAALADTVYISLYKYFGASSGAILCGKKEVMDKMPHLVKIYGGSMYRNWTNAAMALHHVDGYMERLLKAKAQGEELIARLNGLTQMKITAPADATSTYKMELNGVDSARFTAALATQGVKGGSTRFTVNETILYRDNNALFNAFKMALGKAAL